MSQASAPAVTLVDYGVGNTASVSRAFRRLGAEVDFTADLDRVAAARRLVLPGVAAFAPAMNRLLETGLESAVRAAVKRGGRLLDGKSDDILLMAPVSYTHLTLPTILLV